MVNCLEFVVAKFMSDKPAGMYNMNDLISTL